MPGPRPLGERAAGAVQMLMTIAPRALTTADVRAHVTACQTLRAASVQKVLQKS